MSTRTLRGTRTLLRTRTAIGTRRISASAAGAAGAIGILLLTAAPAHAHDVLRGTNPADGSTVATVPVEVELSFDKPTLKLGTAVTVTGPSGQVQTGSPTLVDTVVRQRLRADAPAGKYTVRWRVTSADGHPITGSFEFTAKATRAARAAPSATASDPATGSTGSSDSSDSSTPWAAIAVAGVAGAVGGTAIVLRGRRRRSGGAPS